MLRDKIMARIKKLNVNVFTIDDIIELASHDGIRKELVKMTNEKKILRLMTGVYFVPKPNGDLPLIEEVVDALTRNFNWKMCPTGNYALYLLGLNQQKLNRYEYISSGPQRNYRYNEYSIQFRHVSMQKIKPFSYHTNLMIQSLYTLGSKKITEEILKLLSTKFTLKELEVASNEAKYCVVWIRGYINKIYEIKRNEKTLF